MTDDFRDWSGVFVESIFLLIYTLFIGFIAGILWLLWIPSLGHSRQLIPMRYIPIIETDSYVSSNCPTLAFYRRANRLVIDFGSYDRMRIVISNPECWLWQYDTYGGSCHLKNRVRRVLTG